MRIPQCTSKKTIDELIACPVVAREALVTPEIVNLQNEDLGKESRGPQLQPQRLRLRIGPSMVNERL